MASRKKEVPLNFAGALDLLETERGIKKDVIIEALKEALEKSYKKNYGGPESIVEVDIDGKTGAISLTEIKYVVDDVNDEDFELSIEEAKMIDESYEVGSIVRTEFDPKILSRLAAIQTKQLLRQKIKETEKECLYNEYIDKQDDIITGIVDRVEERFAIINIGKTGALLPQNQQIPGEKIYEGQHLKVYVSDVERNTKGTHISVSRTEPGLVKRLFEMEVPEIFDGTVEIKSVSREAGERSKIAVYTSNDNVDPIGSCVGPKGSRVRNVVNELNGEMIDIIEWNEDPVVFISHALSPSEVVSVSVHEEDRSALVIVPDNQLSLAIGKRGQNARLAVRLTGWKIDIKSQSEAMNEGLLVKMGQSDQEVFNSMIEEELPVEETLEEVTFETVDETSIEEGIQTLEEPMVEETTVEEVKQEELPVVDELKAVEITASTNEEDEEDEEDEDEDYDYDPKYDEDIDYDEFDKYYDEN